MAALVKDEISVFGWRGNHDEYYWCLEETLKKNPNMTIDDGGDLVFTIHKKHPELKHSNFTYDVKDIRDIMYELYGSNRKFAKNPMKFNEFIKHAEAPKKAAPPDIAELYGPKLDKIFKGKIHNLNINIFSEYCSLWDNRLKSFDQDLTFMPVVVKAAKEFAKYIMGNS